MKCVLPGRGIRAFGKAIFCLAKLGDDLYIEALKNGLALKTVNNARSAYACFQFRRSFFLSYSERGGSVGGGAQDDSAQPLKCKISNKSCVLVFKALSTLEKTVDHCRIRWDEEDNKLVFIFHCRHGIIKTHNLGYQETDTVQAVFNKEACTTCLLLQAKILSEVVTYFPTSLDEVTMTVEPAGMRLRNYVDDFEGDDSRVPLTEAALTPTEFDRYQISTNSSLTFCLKELRALLHFTDTISHCLSIKFEAAGKPVIISIEDDHDYHADFVLATLLDDNAPIPSDLPQTTPTSSSAANNTTMAASTTASSRPAQSAAEGDHEVPMQEEEREEEEEELQFENEQDSVAGGNHPTLARPRKRRPNQGMAVKSLQKKTSVDASVSFPSGSQFRRGGSKRRGGTQHVPPPPTEMDFEAMTVSEAPHASANTGKGDMPLSQESNSHVRRASSGSAMVQPGDSSLIPPESEGPNERTNSKHQISLAHSSTPKASAPVPALSGTSTVNDDVMDALFGEDNLDEVAQDGHIFGFQHRVDEKKEEEGESMEQDAAKQDTPENSSGKKGSQVDRTESHLDKEGFEEGSSQNRTLDESSFLPGTPPSKKFKPISVLFGMEMFGGNLHDSEILAANSDSDSDL